MLAEKATTMTDFTAEIPVMDMSMAFDNTQRGTPLADLEKILSPDELHIIKILIKDV